jgi:hypothetical protein
MFRSCDAILLFSAHGEGDGKADQGNDMMTGLPSKSQKTVP